MHIRSSRRKTEKAADGVAIYGNLQSATTCRPIDVTDNNRIPCAKEINVDVSFIEATVDTRITCVLGTVYVHQEHHSEIFTYFSLNLLGLYEATTQSSAR
jgi:hypothetical protein